MPQTSGPDARPMQAETAGWRPMAFRAMARERIENPLFEPLWGGRRVLVEVAAAGHVAIRATDGPELEGHEDLRAAIAGAAQADELLMDGWLVPPPLPGIEDAPALIDIGAVKTPAERLRHMFVGGRSPSGSAEARKRLLDSALAEGELVRRTMVGRPPLERWFARWRALGIEEVIVKAANGRYRPGAVSADWAVAPIPRR